MPERESQSSVRVCVKRLMGERGAMQTASRHNTVIAVKGGGDFRVVIAFEIKGNNRNPAVSVLFANYADAVNTANI